MFLDESEIHNEFLTGLFTILLTTVVIKGTRRRQIHTQPTPSIQIGIYNRRSVAITTDGNPNYIPIQLSDEVVKEGFVESFMKDKRTNILLLTLKHVCKRTTIVSDVYAGDLTKTIERLTKKLKSRGLDDKYIILIEDVVCNNYERILDLSEVGQEKVLSSQYSDQINN